jgi:hypothetical protein
VRPIDADVLIEELSKLYHGPLYSPDYFIQRIKEQPTIGLNEEMQESN